MNWSNPIENFKRYFFPYGVLFIFLVLSFFIYKDYGIAWDEPCQQDFGELAFEKLTSDELNLDYTVEKQRYGVAYEVTLVFFQKLFNIQDDVSIYQFRHLFTHILFLVSSVVFFFYIKRTHLHNLAGVAMMLYLLSPRLYAHSFFNSKDIPLMCFTVISLYLIQSIFIKRTLLSYVFLGIACAYLVNIRIIGIVIPFSFGIIEIAQLLLKKIELKKFLINNLVLLLVFLIGLIFFWPYLWQSPLTRFIDVFTHFQNFWWDDKVLFRGEQIIANQLPWYYSIYWMLITIPFLVLFMFFIGISRFFVLNKNREPELQVGVLVFLIPVVIVPLLSSVVYDGWRHLYFVYPILLMIATYGLNYLKSVSWIGKRWGYLGLIYFVFLSVEMIQIHPYQNVYFNEFTSKYEEEYLRTHYEMDYWGTCYKQGIEKVLELADEDTVLKIAGNGTPLEFNQMLFSDKEKTRFIIVKNIDSADYYISNYRFHPEEYDGLDEIYNKKIYNSRLFSIFKLPK